MGPTQGVLFTIVIISVGVSHASWPSSAMTRDKRSSEGSAPAPSQVQTEFPLRSVAINVHVPRDHDSEMDLYSETSDKTAGVLDIGGGAV